MKILATSTQRAVFFATVAASTLAFVGRSHFSQNSESSIPPTPAARTAKRTTPPVTPAAAAHRGGGGTLDVSDGAAVTAVQPGAHAKVTTVDCGWKDEPELVGTCGSLKVDHKFKHATRKQRSKSADDCASHCCEMGDKCITWQFRQDKGCLVGGDARLGMEKDGPASWCEISAPAQWKGQYLDDRSSACGSGWLPESLPGQCFNLGDRRKIDPDTAEGCRDACCSEPKCKTWQFREDKGCFFAPKRNPCKTEIFKAFTGKRKLVSSRKYKPLAHGKQKMVASNKM